MNVLVLLLNVCTDLFTSTRRHWRCLRCRHWMREMSDGPVCADCGTFWPWRD